MMDCYLGEIRMHAGFFAPHGWAFCNGQSLSIGEHSSLYSLIGATYGGDGTSTFKLPDLRGRLPIHKGQGPGLSPRLCGEQFGNETVTLDESHIKAHTHAVRVGGLAHSASPSACYPASSARKAGTTAWKQYRGSGGHTAIMHTSAVGMWPEKPATPHTNLMPSVCVNFIIALDGAYPPRSSDEIDRAEQAPVPYLGEIRLFSFNHAPQGWAACDGQALSIDENRALYSLLGTTYGGTATTFNLPDLRSRTPLHRSDPYPQGKAGGVEWVAFHGTQSDPQLIGHSHPLLGSTALATTNNPDGMVLATLADGEAASTTHFAYAKEKTGRDYLAADVLAKAGSSAPHDNRQPSLTINYCIALTGSYPNRD